MVAPVGGYVSNQRTISTFIKFLCYGRTFREITFQASPLVIFGQNLNRTETNRLLALTGWKSFSFAISVF
jgi:hypothetical protein